LVELLGGQVINICATSDNCINPLDLNPDYAEEDDPVTLKADFITSMMEVICAGKQGLAPSEKSVLDRCVRLIYKPYLDDPKPENIPILTDLWNSLKEQKTAESKGMADALEIYVTGSQNFFNKRTNVDIRNRLVCYNIKDLGKSSRKLGMLIVQDQIWNRVILNRAAGKATWQYMDEFHRCETFCMLNRLQDLGVLGPRLTGMTSPGVAVGLIWLMAESRRAQTARDAMAAQGLSALSKAEVHKASPTGRSLKETPIGCW
jgi:type IV secretory pathway VirB4 component